MIVKENGADVKDSFLGWGGEEEFTGWAG